MIQLQGKLSARQRRGFDEGSPVSQIFSRKQIEQAFLESFELVGGVPRLALWAAKDENYAEFLQLVMKLAPKDAGKVEGGRVLEYRSNVPPSPLNRTAPAQAPATLETITEAEFTETTPCQNSP